MLGQIVSALPSQRSDGLIVGYESSDDAAVYRLSDESALITTLDFFPPIVADPYEFGRIAAANALSDVYAMGGKALTALNIVCFPENEDPGILADIMRGGAEKTAEAGAVLCGGHSINDTGIKYGLSVTGVVHPEKVLRNNTCRIGDVIILTKPLGTGIIMSANKLSDAGDTSVKAAVASMQRLNKYAAEQAAAFSPNACTDVTGFGLLGHLNEMVSDGYSIEVDSQAVPALPQAVGLAEAFYITAAGQRNRNHLSGKVRIRPGLPLGVLELLYDPQTSGGLLLSIPAVYAKYALSALREVEPSSAIVGRVIARADANITVV